MSVVLTADEVEVVLAMTDTILMECGFLEPDEEALRDKLLGKAA